MPEPSRILLTVSNGGMGGMQVQVGLLARGLCDLGCEVVVAAGPGELDVGPATLLALPELRRHAPGRFALALRAAIADVDPDVVHGHGLRLAPLLAVGGRRRRSLVTCHGLDPARVRRTAVPVRASHVAIAACGEGPRRLLAEVGIAAGVLDNAVSPMPEAPDRRLLLERFAVEDSGLLAVSPARLSPQKDPLTLIRALARCPGVSCVLLGGGPLEAEVRDEIRRLGLGERVAVSPWVRDARDVLAGADVAVLASRWEGQPTVVLEAMAAGVAVVATACTGTAETVVDGSTGLLATPGDPAALAAVLERAKDPSLRAALAAAGRTQVRSHELGTVVARHLDGYRRVLEGRWP
jgi:glycosyltransferase involved in cell wall biosynthesis